MQEELRCESVALSLAAEVTQLRELAVDHNYFGGEVLLAVRDEDAALFGVGGVEFSIKPNASFIASANLLVCVQDVGKVARNSAPVHQAEGTLLDDRAGADSVSNELDNEKANLASELRESEFLGVLDVACVLVGELPLVCSLKSVQIHSRVERLQVFLVVGLCVELENRHVQLVDVFDQQLQ